MMSLTNDPAGHLAEPTTPQHTAPAAPASDAAATDAVASSSALASAVDHSRSTTAASARRGGNRNIERAKAGAMKLAQRLRTEVPKRVRAARQRRAATRR
jgi:hypothetical protein